MWGSPAARRLAVAVVVAATLATGVAVPGASADEYRYTAQDLIASRAKKYPSVFPDPGHPGVENAYKGPRKIVDGWRTDWYQCARDDEDVTGWLAVADDVATHDMSFSSLGSAAFGQGPSYSVTTTNWTIAFAKIRVVFACTADKDVFPYHLSYGDYVDAWNASLDRGSPDWAGLVRDAFKWAPASRAVAADLRAAPAATAPLGTIAQVAREGGNRFALKNGTTTLALSFEHGRTNRRPPAVYFSTRPRRAACDARRMHVPVVDGHGHLRLTVRCRGLRGAATAKLRIRPAIRRTFPLRQGTGRGRIHLDKPPGVVAPLVHVSTRPGSAACKIRSHQVRMARRTVDLRIDGRCGRVPRGAVGELAVGGLLAEDPR